MTQSCTFDAKGPRPDLFKDENATPELSEDSFGSGFSDVMNRALTPPQQPCPFISKNTIPLPGPQTSEVPRENTAPISSDAIPVFADSPDDKRIDGGNLEAQPANSAPVQAFNFAGIIPPLAPPPIQIASEWVGAKTGFEQETQHRTESSSRVLAACNLPTEEAPCTGVANPKAKSNTAHPRDTHRGQPAIASAWGPLKMDAARHTPASDIQIDFRGEQTACCAPANRAKSGIADDGTHEESPETAVLLGTESGREMSQPPAAENTLNVVSASMQALIQSPSNSIDRSAEPKTPSKITDDIRSRKSIQPLEKSPGPAESPSISGRPSLEGRQNNMATPGPAQEAPTLENEVHHSAPLTWHAEKTDLKPVTPKQSPILYTSARTMEKPEVSAKEVVDSKMEDPLEVSIISSPWNRTVATAQKEIAKNHVSTDATSSANTYSQPETKELRFEPAVDDSSVIKSSRQILDNPSPVRQDPATSWPSDVKQLPIKPLSGLDAEIGNAQPGSSDPSTPQSDRPILDGPSPVRQVPAALGSSGVNPLQGKPLSEWRTGTEKGEPTNASTPAMQPDRLVSDSITQNRSTPVISGMPDAKTELSMHKTIKIEQSLPNRGKQVPGESAISEPAPRKAGDQGGDAAVFIANTHFTAKQEGNSSAAPVALSPATIAAQADRIDSVDKMREVILNKVVEMKHVSASAYDIVVKTDNHADLQLRIRQEGQLVVVSARCEPADEQYYKAQWEQLERSMSAKGIETTPLNQTARPVVADAGSSLFDRAGTGSRQDSPYRQAQLMEEEIGTTLAARAVSEGASSHRRGGARLGSGIWENWA